MISAATINQQPANITTQLAAEVTRLTEWRAEWLDKLTSHMAKIINQLTIN